MMRNLLLIGLVLAAGCAKQQADDDDTSTQLVAGFDPPPVMAGYKRYIMPAHHALKPGEDILLCQWIDVADAADSDIEDVKAYQTTTGHHVVLYSSSENEAVGTSRECTTDDMVSVEFLGGTGGEGAGNITKLPDGYVFRKEKGRTLMANVHYLNATDDTVDVQSVVDVKMTPVNAANKPAGMAVINYLDFQIPANSTAYSLDTYCTWPTDTSLIMWSNHQHDRGVSIKSEIKRADNSIVPLATDAPWIAEQAFNPLWTHWDAASPTVIHQGDTVHLNCTWKNEKSTPVTFPDEMCDAVGFYLESGAQMICSATPGMQ